MMVTREKLKKFSEKYHGELHVCFGLLVWLVVWLMNRQVDTAGLFLVVLLGSFLPDIDHIFFMFFYGRNTEYARKEREFMFAGKWKELIDFGKKNHKSNTFILSHNLLTPVLFGWLAWISAGNGNWIWTGFWGAMQMHFVFDILEDWLYFGRLNGNWWFRYGKKAA